MKKSPTLFMLLLGCRPKGRFIEQHDIFFTIGNSLKEIIPDIKNSWKDSGNIHIDSWRMITACDGFKISIVPFDKNLLQSEKLFFFNLGGYKENDLEEYHYKMIVAAKNKASAIKKAKETAFYKHTGFKGATSHIDDKYGIDVDDLYEITDILPAEIKSKYSILIQPSTKSKEDKLNIGYTNLSKIK